MYVGGQHRTWYRLGRLVRIGAWRYVCERDGVAVGELSRPVQPWPYGRWRWGEPSDAAWETSIIVPDVAPDVTPGTIADCEAQVDQRQAERRARIAALASAAIEVDERGISIVVAGTREDVPWDQVQDIVVTARTDEPRTLALKLSNVDTIDGDFVQTVDRTMIVATSRTPGWDAFVARLGEMPGVDRAGLERIVASRGWIHVRQP